MSRYRTLEQLGRDAIFLNGVADRPTRILHWTWGKGTGHVKRVNALWRGFEAAGVRVEYHLCARNLVFPQLLNPRVQVWEPGYPHAFDALIIDQRLDKFPSQMASLAPTVIQLCKLSTRLEGDPAVVARLNRISFENCVLNRQLGLPYEGCLIDADYEQVLSEAQARRALSDLMGLDLSVGPMLLTHANSPDADKACEFLVKGIRKLSKSHKTIVVGTGHLATVCDRLEEEAQQLSQCRILFLDVNPIFPFYRAFDLVHTPIGYNSYCETQLFVQSSCSYDPMFPRDQGLRIKERPEVGSIGNKNIAISILRLIVERRDKVSLQGEVP